MQRHEEGGLEGQTAGEKREKDARRTRIWNFLGTFLLFRDGRLIKTIARCTVDERVRSRLAIVGVPWRPGSALTDMWESFLD